MKTKGVSLSFNTIIIAVIGLLVLALIVFLLSNNLGNFNEGTRCAQKGGRCVEECDQDKYYGETDEDGNQLCKPGMKCCSLVPIR